MNRKPTKNMNARKSLRRQSLKRQRLMRVAGPWRDEYLSEHLVCAYLGCRRPAVDVHELARGPSRAKSLMEPAALLALCRSHHNEIQNWKLPVQLALKRLANPDEFCRLTVLRLRVSGGDPHRMDSSVTEEEVTEAMRDLICPPKNN